MASLAEAAEAGLTTPEAIIPWVRALHRISKEEGKDVPLAYRQLRAPLHQQGHQFLVLHLQVLIRSRQRQPLRPLILQLIFKLANASIRLRQSFAQLIRHDLSTIVR